MTTDLSELKLHASALYELLQESDNRDANAHLRKIIYQLEMMDAASQVVPQSERELANWLVYICDAEHGTLVKHYPDEPNTHDAASIDQHVKVRRKQLQSGMMLQANVERGVKHLAGMLGTSGPQGMAVADRIPWFANVLLEHLRQDQEMGKKLHELALATMESLRSVQEMLVGIGTESPELQHVATMLSQPVPQDPAEARDYLQQISHSLQQVQRNMIEGSARMQDDIGDRVQAFEDVSSQFSEAQDNIRSDTLTGLPNRKALTGFLMQQPGHTSLSLAILDIDQLQQINAITGQAGGNRCLCDLADLLIGCVRPDDMVFRVGGDEFIIVFPGMDHQTASQSVQGLQHEIHFMQFNLTGHDIQLRVSFGLAERASHETLHNWIKRADAALYVAKGKGGNRIEIAA